MFPIKTKLHVNDTFTFIFFFFANLNFVCASVRRKLRFEITGFNAQAVFWCFSWAILKQEKVWRLINISINLSSVKVCSNMHKKCFTIFLIVEPWVYSSRIDLNASRLGSIRLITVLFHVANLSFCVSTIKFRAFFSSCSVEFNIYASKNYFFFIFFFLFNSFFSPISNMRASSYGDKKKLVGSFVAEISIFLFYSYVFITIVWLRLSTSMELKKTIGASQWSFKA